MFLGYFSSVPTVRNSQIQEAQKTISYCNGFLSFFPIQDTSSHPYVLAILGVDDTICVKNVPEGNFKTKFNSYIEFFEYLEEKSYYSKITTILYDENKCEVTIIRDLFGTTPLFYIHIPHKLFAFSSSLASLILIPELKSYLDLNDSRVSEYLSWLWDSNLYTTSTFFTHFSTVLPGHKITLNLKNSESSVFHKLDLSKRDTPNDLMESGEIFRSIFKESVQNALKENEFISAQLSGGLDSSSVCCMIRDCQQNIPIHTIYTDTGTVLTDEISFVDEVTKKIDSTNYVIQPEPNDFEIASLHISLYGHPEYMQNSPSLNRTMIQCAKSYGSSSLFSGHPGDAIVGYGDDYISELFKAGQWSILRDILSDPEIQLLNLVNDKNDQDNPNFKIVYSLLAQEKSRLNKYELIKLVFKVSRSFNIPLSFFFSNGIRKLTDKFILPTSVLRNKTILGQNTNIRHCNSTESVIGIERMTDPDHYNYLYGTQSMSFNEEIYILDSYYKVNNVFPLYDKALLEYCMIVPSQIKYNNGLRRGHFREAMKGILPELVRIRRSKGNFGMYGRRATLSLYSQAEEVLAEDSLVWKYVDKSKFNRSLNLLMNDSQPLYIYNRTLFFVSRTIYLAIWLHKLKNRDFHPSI